MRRVRAECAAASVRLGHPVRLGVRVPSRPETARRCGLDAVAWAREGLVDLVVVTPFWATIEFDMPMLEWKRLLEGTGVRLAGGLEIRYQPVPNGPAGVVTPELAAGAAMSVLHGGGDLVYLFNYMPGRFTPDTDWGNGVARTWGVGRYRSVLRAMRSEEGLEPIARTHAITYPDIRAPGDPAAGALPGGWRGEDMPWPSGCSFRIPTGPRPSGRAVTLVIGFTPETRAPGSTKFYVNGVPCPGRWDPADRMLAVPLPAAILQDEAQVVQAYASPGNPFAIVKAEIAVAAR